MTDAAIAKIGRELAVALSNRARERTPETTKEAALKMTELCAAVRKEHEEVPSDGVAADSPQQ